MKRSFVGFRDGKLDDRQSSNPLLWGVGSRYLGSISFAGDQYFAIETLGKKGHKYVELRSPLQNIVVHKSSSLGSRAHGVAVYNSPKGFWLLYKKQIEGQSLDDTAVRIMEFEVKSGVEQLSHKISKTSAIPADFQAAAVGDGSLFVMWRKTQKKKSGELNKFSYIALENAQDKPSTYELGESFQEHLESWTMAQHREGILLVLVLGDTLIWENASMEVRSLDRQGDQLWAKSLPINGEHIGDPLIVPSSTFSYLVIPKWLDAESTVEIKKVGARNLSSLGVHGIYKQGTYIHSGFLGDDQDELFLMKRYPSGFIKKYSICELSL